MNQAQAYVDGLIDALQGLIVNRTQALNQYDSVDRADLVEYCGGGNRQAGDCVRSQQDADGVERKTYRESCRYERPCEGSLSGPNYTHLLSLMSRRMAQPGMDKITT